MTGKNRIMICGPKRARRQLPSSSRGAAHSKFARAACAMVGAGGPRRGCAYRGPGGLGQ